MDDLNTKYQVLFNPAKKRRQDLHFEDEDSNYVKLSMLKEGIVLQDVPMADSAKRIEAIVATSSISFLGSRSK